MLRVVDELDDVLVQSTPAVNRMRPSSNGVCLIGSFCFYYPLAFLVGFNFSLRKGMIIGDCVDKDALRTNFITVDVVRSSEFMPILLSKCCALSLGVSSRCRVCEGGV